VECRVWNAILKNSQTNFALAFRILYAFLTKGKFMKDFFYLYTFKFVSLLTRLTPRFLQDAFFCSLAWLWFYVDKKHRFIVLANLRHCFPEKSQEELLKIAKATYRNFAYFATDFLRNQNATKESLLEKVEFENWEFLQEAVALGNGVIVQTAHYGNWELFSLAVAAQTGGVSIVGRELESSGVNALLSRHRQQFDIELISKYNGAKPMLQAIRRKRLLGVLIDQSVTKSEGVKCKFFGRDVTHSTALSIFSAKTKAVIVPAFIYRKNRDKCVIRFYKMFAANGNSEEEILRVTQLQSDHTEEIIRFKPDEYFWFHKRFKQFDPQIYEGYMEREHDKNGKNGKKEKK